MKQIMKAGLIGKETTNSLSPKIYSTLAEIFELDFSYDLLSVPEDQFHSLLPHYLTKFDALNITHPFKRKAFEILAQSHSIDPLTDKLKNCNTIDSHREPWLIYNTDFFGIIKSLKKLSLAGKKVFIFGAGDVTQTLIHALKELHVQKIYVCNRSHRQIDDERVQFVLWDNYDDQISQCDLLINATPAGKLNGERLPFLEQDYLKLQTLFDLNYHRANSQLDRYCQEYHKSFIDGLEMLVWQAMKNLEYWYNFTIDDSDKIFKRVYRRTKGPPMALLGFMGSGKSSISKKLSNGPHFQALDLDSLIEKKHHCSIQELIRSHGIETFREIEYQEIQSLFYSDQEFDLLSLGGGTLLNPKSQKFVFENFKTLYLETNLEVIKERLAKDRTRPLLKTAPIEKLYEEREPYYLMAHKKIKTQNRSIDDLSEIVLNETQK